MLPARRRRPSAAPLPDDAALSLLEGQAAALQSDMVALTGQRSAANEARTAAAEAHAVWEAHPLYPDDAAALERRAASIAPAKAPSLLLPAADGLLLAICAVLAVVFRAASPQRWIFAGMALLAAALTVFSVCLRRRAIRQEQERVDRDLWRSRQPRTCPSATAPPRPTKPPAAPAPSSPVPRRAAAAAC